MKLDTTIRRWDQLEVKITISRLATLRMRAGLLLIKLGVRVMGCGLTVMEPEVRDDNEN